MVTERLVELIVCIQNAAVQLCERIGKREQTGDVGAVRNAAVHVPVVRIEMVVDERDAFHIHVIADDHAVHILGDLLVQFLLLA